MYMYLLFLHIILLNSYPVGLPPDVGEDAVRPVVVLVEEAEHEGEVVDHQRTDALQLVADGCDGGHAATGLAGLRRIHGQRGPLPGSGYRLTCLSQAHQPRSLLFKREETSCE